MSAAIARLERRWRRFAEDQLTAGGLGPAAELSLRFADGSRHRWLVDPERGLEVSRSKPVFDLASLSKPLLTGALLMDALSAGRLELDSEAVLESSGRASGFTIREALQHRAGLAPEASGAKEAAKTRLSGSEIEANRRAVLEDVLGPRAGPRGQECYSDLSYIALGMALEQSSGASLRSLAELALSEALPQREVDSPSLWADESGAALALTPVPRDHCFPTELRPWGEPAWGEVHDEAASRLGGIAGHAGLFGNGLGVFLLLEPWLQGARRWSLTLMHDLMNSPDRSTRRGPWMSSQGRPGAPSFGLGWLGHTGFTGTALWFHPEGRAVSLLTSRCWPQRPADSTRIQEFRRACFDMLGEELEWSEPRSSSHSTSADRV